jgi:hypothetical protein
MQMGYAPEEWKDRPVIAILNTWSDAKYFATVPIRSARLSKIVRPARCW